MSVSEWSTVKEFTTTANYNMMFEEGILSASDGASGHYLGAAVSMDATGTRVIVGARGATPGQAYIYVRDGNTWTEEAILTPSDNGAVFGITVSMDSTGSRVAIGAIATESWKGRAYVFRRDSTTWVEEGILNASNGATNHYFGESITIDPTGTRVMVGSVGFGSTISRGRAYVFVRSGTTWTQEAYLLASNGASNHRFGTSVATNSTSDILAIGAETATNDARGRVYIFTRSGSTWTETAILAASDGGVNHNFGKSVALNSDGSLLAIGAHNRERVYIFTRDGSTWTEEVILAPIDVHPFYRFGISIALTPDGNKLLIGAANADNYKGQAYIFIRNGSEWSGEAILIASDNANNSYFGTSVSMDSNGNRAVIGSPNIYNNRGQAYFFS